MSHDADTEKQGPTERVLVRLKHSLEEGQEIETVMPDTLAEFDAALAAPGLVPRWARWVP